MTTFDEARDIVEAWSKDYGVFDRGSPGRQVAVDDLAARICIALTHRELKLDAIAEILKDK